jgi:hypothetical protein
VLARQLAMTLAMSFATWRGGEERRRIRRRKNLARSRI